MHKVAFSRRASRLKNGPELFDDKDFEFVIDPVTKLPLDYKVEEMMDS